MAIVAQTSVVVNRNTRNHQEQIGFGLYTQCFYATLDGRQFLRRVRWTGYAQSGLQPRLGDPRLRLLPAKEAGRSLEPLAERETGTRTGTGEAERRRTSAILPLSRRQ